MITNLKIIFSAVSLFMSLVFPIMLAVWFCKKYKTSAGTVLLGALTFLVFQLLTRLPLLAVLNPIWLGLQLPTGTKLFLYGLFLSITAALFEEFGRVIIFKLFLKKKGDWRNATAFGIGHGGFEAVALVGITYINNVVLMILMRAGIMKMGSGVDPMINQVLQLLADTPSYLFLIAGLERVFAITIHIGFSLLVVYGLVSKRYIYIFYSILAHTLLNFPTIYIQSIPYGTYVITVYIGLLAVLSLYWISRVSPELFKKLEINEEV